MTENDVNITVNFTGTETGIIPVLPDQSINYDHTAILRFCDGWVSSVCLSVCPHFIFKFHDWITFKRVELSS